MAIAQKLAGYSLGQADLLRRAMGKKKKAELDKQFETFSAGMTERGFSMAAIKALWDILLPFSDYAFNKAHSAAYGLVVLLDGLPQGQLPGRVHGRRPHVRQGRQGQDGDLPQRVPPDGIKVLPPDVNESEANFTPVGDRHPLRPLRDPQRRHPTSSTRSSRPAREQGRFTDFADFMDKVPTLVCNKRVVESLVKAGAFDSLGHRRRALVAIHETRRRPVRRHQAQRGDRPGLALRRARRGRRRRLRGGRSRCPTSPSGTSRRCSAHEREMLGLYVSDHPLMGLEHILAASADCTIGQLLVDEDRPDGSTVTVSGLITSVQRKITKRGDAWAMVTVEDLEGGIDVLLFPSAYQLASTLLNEDAIVTVKGRLSRSKDQPELHGQEVSVPDLADGPPARW